MENQKIEIRYVMRNRTGQKQNSELRKRQTKSKHRAQAIKSNPTRKLAMPFKTIESKE